MTGLLILFTVVSLPYPSGSSLDFCYNFMCVSTLCFLYVYAIRQCQTNDPQELIICFQFLLPLCPFFFPLFCPSVVLSPVLSSLSTNLLHFTIVLLFPQECEPDFSNVGSMMECGLFSEALDTLRSAVFPGLLPPAPFLISLLEYAQQVGPKLRDLKTLQTSLQHNLICYIFGYLYIT